MNVKLLLVKRQEDIVVLTMNRPNKRNALSNALVTALENSFARLPKGSLCIVLQVAGEDFSAKLDVIDLIDAGTPNPVLFMRRSTQWHRVFDLIQFGGVPFVSVLKGDLIGGGRELATAAHLRVSERSVFVQLPEGQLGIFVGGGSVRIPSTLGDLCVIEIMLTGHSHDAEASLQLGLSHYVLDDGASAYPFADNHLRAPCDFVRARAPRRLKLHGGESTRSVIKSESSGLMTGV